jgi:hypothetical protein
LPANYGIPVIISFLTSESDIENPYDDKKTNGTLYANCIVNKTVNASENELLPVTFECSTENLEDLNETTPLIVVSSYDINGFNSPVFLLPGEIKNVSNEVPPVFTPSSINTEKCNKYGIIYIKGKFDKNIEDEGEFKSNLLSGHPITCQYEKYEKDVEVEIKCYLLKEFRDSKIALDFYPILKVKQTLKYLNLVYINEKSLIIIKKFLIQNYLSFPWVILLR